MDFNFNGRDYEVKQDLTLGQMEIVSNLLDEERKTIIESALDSAKSLKEAANIVVSSADVFNSIVKNGKLIAVCSALAVEKGKVFSKESFELNKAVFVDLPFVVAERVVGFFYQSESASSWIFPSFLRVQAQK